MSTQLSWTEWFRWIHVLLWPAAAWGALRIVTGWGYRPLPIRRDRLGAFAGWLALAGCFGSVAQFAINLLSSGLGLTVMLADVSSPSSGEFPREAWFFVLWTLVNFIVLGAALWFGSWLVHRIDWERVGGAETLDPPKPSASGWRHVYLSMAVAASIRPLNMATAGLLVMVLSGPTTDLLEPATIASALALLASIAVAAWFARCLVDDLLSSELMRSNQAPPVPRLRQGLWVGAVGLLITGLWTIPNAILAIVDSRSISFGTDSPTFELSLLRLSSWIYLAALVGLSVLMLRLLPKPLAESGPRHALRGVRRLTIAVALASTMVWPLEFLRTLMDASASLHVGSTASRNLLIVAGVAIVIWLLTWRPKVQP